jgi:hypothetical protein
MSPYPSAHWRWVEKWIESGKFKGTPARIDILIWTIILWVVWLNENDVLNVLPILNNINISFSLPFNIKFNSSPFNYQFTLSSIFSPFVIKGFFALFFAVVSHFSLQVFTYHDHKAIQYIGKTDINRVVDLLKLLDERAGIKCIYEGERGKPASKQKYSTDIEKDVSETKSLKILSIAGYENIGKGEGLSLLYSILKRDCGLDVEVILLDPAAEEIIKERIKQLQHNNPQYSNGQMKSEINETIERLKTLKKIRNNDTVKIYLYNDHPIFRLIICDDCLYMNTYETDFHGHESPVYRICRTHSEERNKLSLYSTFLNYFEKIKRLSKET